MDIYNSVIGAILLEADDQHITGLNFLNVTNPSLVLNENHVIRQAKQELNQYFSGERKSFDVKIKVEGTEFRKKCWHELLKIPYGKAISYKELAIAVGNPSASRAVGGANHNNKISIIIPCHRVIGANGSLVGYGGELWRKQWLLDHERKYIGE